MSSSSTDSQGSDAHWYPYEQSPAMQQLTLLLKEQLMEMGNKLLSARNEIMILRQEILTLKQSFLELNEKFVNLKPSIDERKKNRLLRGHIPFSFTPDKV